jgi:hypothetical protein
MKVIQIIILLATTSCVKNFNIMTNDLKKSMSEQEVETVMGKSEEKKVYYNKNILVYYVHNSIFDMIFSKNFPYIGFFPFNRTGKEFWIVLEDEGVVAFGYAGDFGKKLAL